jgi:hypothetical protein
MGSGLVCPVSFIPVTSLRGETVLTNPRNLVVYARKLDVINRGLSGFNTEWAIPVFEQVSWVDFFIKVSERATNGVIDDDRSLPKRRNRLASLLYAC